MPHLHPPLRLVDRRLDAPRAAAPSAGDLVLVATLCAVSLVPILGELAHAGRFGTGTVGLATAVLLLAGRELFGELVSLARERLHPPAPRTSPRDGSLPSRRPA